MILYSWLLVAVTLGSGSYIAHCRKAPNGCETRIQAFSEYFTEAGRAYNIPPKLLASVAIHESGLNPAAVSSIGAFSIMQLNPRRYWGKRVRKKPCRAAGACQRPAVMAAAKWFRTGVNICGSYRRALTWYASGECGTSRYSRRVLKIYNSNSK